MMLGSTALKNCGLAFVMMTGAIGMGACSASPNADTASGESAIQGGVEVQSAKLDAVGSLVIDIPGYPRQAFCTATLIGPRLVITAKHCAMTPAALSQDGRDHYLAEYGTISFAIGNDAYNPRQLVKAESAKITALMQGGAGYGSDVAVYVLSQPVTGVTPLAIASAPIAEADIGKAYTAIGYGVRDAAGSAGLRRMGSITLSLRSGAPNHIAYATYEAYKASIEQRIGRPVTAAEEQQVRQMYDAPLLEDYEAFFGSKDGDTQSCSGDSGGPLLRKEGGNIAVWGVASWVPEKSATTELCAKGIVYSTFGPSARDLLDQTQTQMRDNPCGTETVDGRCDGDVAVRCVTEAEGGPQVTRTKCGELDLTCGLIGGKAGCVDAPAAPAAPAN